MKHRGLKLVIFLALLLSVAPAHSQGTIDDASTSTNPKNLVPEDEFDRGTPQRALIGFLSAAQDRDFERAIEYLDLRNLPRNMQPVNGARLARQLSIVIERAIWLDYEEIDDTPAGAAADGQPSYRDKFGVIETEDQSYELLLQRVPRADGVSIWKVSNRTIQMVPELYSLFGYGAVAERVINVIPDVTFLHVELFKWVIVLGTLIVGFPLLFILLRLIASRIVKTDSPMRGRVHDFFTRPLLWFFLVVITNKTLYSMGLGIEAQRLADAHTVNIIVSTWVLLAATGVVLEVYKNRLLQQGRPSAVVLLGPIDKGVKAVLILSAILIWLSNLGYNITALLAGLGVGGIAIALALQKPLEDVFGAINIFAQQPIRIGDFCKFGHIVGTVEEIGLRTTRIRTQNNTLVSIPNATISGDIVDNYSKRETYWYHPKLILRYDTTPDQLDAVRSASLEILEAHDRVLEDPLRVRFNGFGNHGFIVDVFAYIKASSFPEFLEVGEELNLAITRVVNSAGAGFAVPVRWYDDEAR